MAVAHIFSDVNQPSLDVVDVCIDSICARTPTPHSYKQYNGDEETIKQFVMVLKTLTLEAMSITSTSQNMNMENPAYIS